MIVGKLTQEQACMAIEEAGGILSTCTIGSMLVRLVALNGKNLLLVEDPYSAENVVVYPQWDTEWWQEGGPLLRDWGHVIFACGEWLTHSSSQIKKVEE